MVLTTLLAAALIGGAALIALRHGPGPRPLTAAELDPARFHLGHVTTIDGPPPPRLIDWQHDYPADCGDDLADIIDLDLHRIGA